MSSRRADREIREVRGAEFLETAVPLQAYAFGLSPAPAEGPERQRDELDYRADHRSLVAFLGGRAQATAAAIPMRQNVRGTVLAMAGICGVATHPEARRRGHVRALMDQLHADMRDTGHAVAALYPFRTSFYERFGYVGLPRPRRVRLFGEGLAGLLGAGFSGGTTVHRIKEAFPDYQRLCEALLAERHGLCLEPASSLRRLADDDRHWVALAWAGDDPVGALLYGRGQHPQELRVDALAYRDPTARALLLRWLARHLDQVSSFVVPLAPDDRPELWYADAHYDDETRVAVPGHNPPMARVLRAEGLTGLTVGAGRVTVEVVNDPFVGGVWTLDGTAGCLEVRAGGDPAGRLTSHGLASLVYGVLDPAELGPRGFGALEPDAEQTLRVMFPTTAPYLFTQF